MRRATITLVCLLWALSVQGQENSTEEEWHETGETIHATCAAAYWILYDEAVGAGEESEYIADMMALHVQESSPDQALYTVRVLVTLRSAGAMTLEDMWRFARTACTAQLYG